MQLIKLVPQPIRTLVYLPYLIHQLPTPYKGYENYSGHYATEFGKHWIKTILRTTLAAAAIFIVFATKASLPAALALGVVVSTISLPAGMIAAGSYAAYLGVSLVVASLSTGSIIAGLTLLPAAWYSLEHHNFEKITDIGYSESSFERIAKKAANKAFVNL